MSFARSELSILCPTLHLFPLCPHKEADDVLWGTAGELLGSSKRGLLWSLLNPDLLGHLSLFFVRGKGMSLLWIPGSWWYLDKEERLSLHFWLWGAWLHVPVQIPTHPMLKKKLTSLNFGLGNWEWKHFSSELSVLYEHLKGNTFNTGALIKSIRQFVFLMKKNLDAQNRWYKQPCFPKCLLFNLLNKFWILWR